MEKQIACISDLAVILQQQFVHGFYHDKLPLVIYDPYGVKICEIRADDPKKWVKTPYEYSIAASRKLCTRKRWAQMGIVEQVELCGCWYELAIEAYLDPAYDAGADFEIEDA